MQNRYAGDIGDFGKLGLLRVLQDAGFSIGVNWYLTPDENHNQDGKHTNYDGLRPCDERLWRELKQIVDSDRNVAALQTDRILKATFYEKPLDFKGKKKAERREIRENWHQNALKKLSGLDLVFVDPDNGLIVKSAEKKPKENKFVLTKELADYYEQGSSVIYYQHKARRQDSYYEDQHRQLLSRPEFAGASGLGIKFWKTSHRYYFFILQPEHKAKVTKAVREMLKLEWNNCFSELPIE
jgi:hypothetical protein